MCVINDMFVLIDKKGVERFFGIVNYLGKFILNLVIVIEFIRVLL